MPCEYLGTCPYFNARVEISQEVLALYRIRYCRGTPPDCARYLVAVAYGRSAVPLDLHPTDQLKALRIVRTREGERPDHEPEATPR